MAPTPFPPPALSQYMLMHSVYTDEEVLGLKTDVHFPPVGFRDKLALAAITAVRSVFDVLSGYDARPGKMTEDKYLIRAIFLETVAGVPGMVASMTRHFESLRLMRRDNGWIHSLLAEAENERMHLLTFLELKQPGPLMRLAVLGTQGIFFNGFFLCYLLAPSFCHRFVGYLEEEAVRTYTRCVEDLDAGHLPKVRVVVVAVFLRGGSACFDFVSFSALLNAPTHFLRSGRSCPRLPLPSATGASRTRR